MPDFEVCRVSMSKQGILNGKQMCEAILKEHQVAVRDFHTVKEKKLIKMGSVHFHFSFCPDRTFYEKTKN